MATAVPPTTAKTARTTRRNPVQPFPESPAATDAPEVTEEGHLWLLELVEGAPLRFELQASGLLRFGDAQREYQDADDLPLSVQAAVRHVRERFDRDALRAAVDSPTWVTFFGVATRYEGVEYDWDRLPPFLGTEVWAGGEFRPPDAAAAIFEQLALTPANVLERERRARDFDPASYEFPESSWYDGPVAGVLVRNKRGAGASLRNPGAGAEPEPLDLESEELAERFATPARFDAIAERVRETGQAASVDALLDRLVENVAREQYGRLERSRWTFDPAAFRSAAAPLARAWLDEA